MLQQIQFFAFLRLLYISLLFFILLIHMGCRSDNQNQRQSEIEENGHAGIDLSNEEARLNQLKSSYLEKYGATNNLLHFSEFLTENQQDVEEGAVLHFIFLTHILGGTEGWEYITEDPLIYFVKDFEIMYHKQYPKSTYEEEIIDILANYFLENNNQTPYNMVTIDSSGNELRIGDFQNKVVVLDFWATWCVPCLEQMPYLEEIKKEYKDQGVVFITVNMDDKEDKWKKFIQKKKPKNELTTRLPEGGSDPQATEMGVNALPVYQFIGKDGKFITQDGPKPASKVFAAILEKSLKST